MLLAIPLSLLVLGAVLAYSAYAENHLVSSRALILHVAHDRKVRPEIAELLIAREYEQLVRQFERT